VLNTPTPGYARKDRGKEFNFFDEVTPMVITYNEEANIARTLAKLGWARRILVIDSGSTDATLEIVRSFRQADVVHRPFDNFASQCNFGLEQVASPWVLSLDADYELSTELVAEIGSLWPSDTTGGFVSRFVYRIHGHSLRGSLYPPRVVLYRKQGAFYRNEGHGHRVVVTGEVVPLAGAIYHDDRKPLARWLTSQQIYALREAEHLLSANRSTLKNADRIRLAIWPAPFLALVYTLFVKGCLFDGWPGWFYALQRLLAETMIALAILDRRLKQRRA
jgi:glycosyltransferase involved in cell wall biosynthesis